MHQRHVRREEARGAVVGGSDGGGDDLRGPAQPSLPCRATWRTSSTPSSARRRASTATAGARLRFPFAPAEGSPLPLLHQLPPSAAGFPVRVYWYRGVSPRRKETLQSDGRYSDEGSRAASGPDSIGYLEEGRVDIWYVSFFFLFLYIWPSFLSSSFRGIIAD